MAVLPPAGRRRLPRTHEDPRLGRCSVAGTSTRASARRGAGRRRVVRGHGPLPLVGARPRQRRGCALTRHARVGPYRGACRRVVRVPGEPAPERARAGLARREQLRHVPGRHGSWRGGSPDRLVPGVRGRPLGVHGHGAPGCSVGRQPVPASRPRRHPHGCRRGPLRLRTCRVRRAAELLDHLNARVRRGGAVAGRTARR